MRGLIERSRVGDQSAFSGLVSLWGTPLLGATLSQQPDPDLAMKELTAGLTRLYLALPTWHPRSAFRPWLVETVVPGASQPSPKSGSRFWKRTDQSKLLATDVSLRLPANYFSSHVEPNLSEPMRLRADRELRGRASLGRCLDLLSRSLISLGAKRTPRHATTTRVETDAGTGLIIEVPVPAGSVVFTYAIQVEPPSCSVILRGIATPRGRLVERQTSKWLSRHQDAIVSVTGAAANALAEG